MIFNGLFGVLVVVDLTSVVVVVVVVVEMNSLQASIELRCSLRGSDLKVICLPTSSIQNTLYCPHHHPDHHDDITMTIMMMIFSPASFS